MKNKIKEAFKFTGEAMVPFGKALAVCYAFYMVIYAVVVFIAKLVTKDD